MPYVSILASPGSDLLRVAATDQPVVIAQPVTSDGIFGERPEVIVFQREIPDTVPLLDRLHTTLASSCTDPDADVFACPVPQAVRAIEVAVAELWPPHRVLCPTCQHRFVAHHKEARRMYLACPHCHNSLLNPGWDSTCRAEARGMARGTGYCASTALPPAGIHPSLPLRHFTEPRHPDDALALASIPAAGPRLPKCTMPLSSKARAFWPVALTVFLADCTTKAVAVRELTPAHVPHPVLGDFLRFTLTYNRAAAMNLSLGPLSRPILAVVSCLALVGLLEWYRRTAPGAILRIIALGLIWAGAAGNLWDRVRGPRGVVDFIDLGVGSSRFWIFNVADVGISLGAVLLAWSLSRDDADSSAG